MERVRLRRCCVAMVGRFYPSVWVESSELEVNGRRRGVGGGLGPRSPCRPQPSPSPAPAWWMALVNRGGVTGCVTAGRSTTGVR